MNGIFFPKSGPLHVKGDSQILSEMQFATGRVGIQSGSTGHTITVFSNLGTNRLTLGSLMSTIKFQNSFRTDSGTTVAMENSQVKVERVASGNIVAVSDSRQINFPECRVK